MATRNDVRADHNAPTIISLASIRNAEKRYANLVTTTTVLIGNFRNDLLWAAEGLAVNGRWRVSFLSHPAGTPFEYDPQSLRALEYEDHAVRAVMGARRDLSRALKALHRVEGRLPRPKTLPSWRRCSGSLTSGHGRRRLQRRP
jgi:hypothetical protein